MHPPSKSSAAAPTQAQNARAPTEIAGFNRHSAWLLGFLLLSALAVIGWEWPLVQRLLARAAARDQPWYRSVDWLLLGVFAFMTAAICRRPRPRADLAMLGIGACGGLIIESWGTQSELWRYFTGERPPLWIIPAWPIASLAIDRVTRALEHHAPQAEHRRGYWLAYALLFGTFWLMLLDFVAPAWRLPSTLAVIAACGWLILRPLDPRRAVLTFCAGSALGYFLERWGTTRHCWTYYTLQTPPPLAVLAHGMTAVWFWRTRRVLRLWTAAWRRPRSGAALPD